jgi:hypothetical protein
MYADRAEDQVDRKLRTSGLTYIIHHHQWHYSPNWALASLTGFPDG